MLQKAGGKGQAHAPVGRRVQPELFERGQFANQRRKIPGQHRQRNIGQHEIFDRHCVAVAGVSGIVVYFALAHVASGIPDLCIGGTFQDKSFDFVG